MLRVGLTSTRVAGRQPASFVHYPMPRQSRVTEMRDTAHDPCGPSVTTKRSQLPVRHHPPTWYLRDNCLDPSTKI